MTAHGSLERQVMDLLWDEGEMPVRGVLERLGSGRAYTTILTVLDRLHRKGEVRRRKQDGAWIYRAGRTREESLGAELTSLLEEAGGRREAVLMAFIETAESVDAGLLARLEELIRARRRSRGR